MSFLPGVELDIPRVLGYIQTLRDDTLSLSHDRRRNAEKKQLTGRVAHRRWTLAAAGLGDGATWRQNGRTGTAPATDCRPTMAGPAPPSSAQPRPVPPTDTPRSAPAPGRLVPGELDVFFTAPCCFSFIIWFSLQSSQPRFDSPVDGQPLLQLHIWSAPLPSTLLLVITFQISK